MPAPPLCVAVRWVVEQMRQWAERTVVGEHRRPAHCLGVHHHPAQRVGWLRAGVVRFGRREQYQRERDEQEERQRIRNQELDAKREVKSRL